MFIYKISSIFKNYSSTVSFGQSQNGNIKVSVILPIYNQEKYLAKALDSLQNQTLEETEFICVNDGSDSSKDKSLEILNNYAKKDKRVKIINQQNQGAGPARNNGLKLAQGKYVAFLDPDDWLDKDALETVYSKSKKQNCDMLVFNFKNIDERTGKVTPGFDVGERIRKVYPMLDEQKNFNWKDIKPKVFRALLWMAWNKLYNRELIQNAQLRFSDSSLAEDNVFVFGATLNANNIGYLDKYIYNYVQHEGSALHKCSDKNLCIFKAIEDVKKLIASKGLTEELKAEFDDYVLKLLSIHSKQILSKDKLKEMCLKHLSENQNNLLKEQKQFIA